MTFGKHSVWAGPLFEGHVCSVGYEVLDQIHQYMCHGVGDIQGKPLDLDNEIRDYVIDIYRIDPTSGRRVYNEAVFSRPKGRAKSELAGLIGVAEAFLRVRFDGWDANGQPVARRVNSPLIKCLATEESQAGNTFSNIAYIAGEWGQDNWPEIYGGASGWRNYQSATAIYLPHGGEIRACTSGSASKDGGLETHVIADETHLYVLKELREMYAVIRRNMGKRYDADPWLHQTSTACKPGELSVFETTMTMWRKGELDDSVLVDHREAKGRIDIKDHDHTIRQLRQVYGAAAEWIDLERKFREMNDPRICADESVAARYYLNRSMSGRDSWIPDAIVERQERKPNEVVNEGDFITIGFDGSLNDDCTVLFGCRMSDGFLWPIQIWAKPTGPEGNWWVVPRVDVMAKIRDTYERYNVVCGYFDPHEWRTDIADLQEEYGDKAIPWETGRFVAMSAALDRLRTDLMNGIAWHNGDKVMMEHFRNAYVRMRGFHRLVRKENETSDRKIDSVIGATLAYEARADLLSNGWTATPPPVERRVLVFRR